MEERLEAKMSETKAEVAPITMVEIEIDVTVKEEGQQETDCKDKEGQNAAETTGETKGRRRRQLGPPRRPVHCEHCGREYRSAAAMRVHLRTHTKEKPYMCTTCGAKFTQGTHLANHEMSHTGFKPYACPYEDCTKLFSRKSLLSRHEKVHTGYKPHACQVCEKAFAQKTNLTMHMKVHNNERPHECAVCQKRFVTRSKMQLHMNKHLKKKCPTELVEIVESESDSEYIV